jgi:hypothetical protein
VDGAGGRVEAEGEQAEIDAGGGAHRCVSASEGGRGGSGGRKDGKGRGGTGGGSRTLLRFADCEQDLS